MVCPSSPQGLRAADRSKSIGHLTFPQCQEEITDQEEQHMLNQALQREARSSGGTESYFSNKHCSFSTTCAVGQRCHHSWAARGVTSSLASARCHHSSSCSKGHVQNECLQGFHGNAERFTPLWAGGRTGHAEWDFKVSLAWCPAKGSEQLPSSSLHILLLTLDGSRTPLLPRVTVKAIQTKHHICVFNSLTPRKILCNQLAKSKKHLHAWS